MVYMPKRIIVVRKVDMERHVSLDGLFGRANRALSQLAPLLLLLLLLLLALLP